MCGGSSGEKNHSVRESGHCIADALKVNRQVVGPVYTAATGSVSFNPAQQARLATAGCFPL